MNERLILKKAERGSTPHRDTIPAVWAVLSPDFREEIYEGTFQDCEKYLRNSCANGTCED
jgi:hypothetical protein